jgi:DNA-directed RNA polymerase specialized sigma24 family protein
MRAVPGSDRDQLSAEDRRELEALSRSTKSEARMQLHSRFVLLVAEGAATREISRRLGCPIGTVSKWRVRHASDRLAGSRRSANGR